MTTWRPWSLPKPDPDKPASQWQLTDAQAKVYVEVYLSTPGIHDEKRKVAWRAAVESA